MKEKRKRQKVSYGEKGVMEGRCEEWKERRIKVIKEREGGMDEERDG